MNVRRVTEPRTPEEEFLHGELANIQREYLQAAKPFVDRLVTIERMRTPRYFISASSIMSMDEVEDLLRK